MFVDSAFASGDNVTQAITYLLKRVEAIDIERGLVMITTRGNAKNARKWIIFQVNDKSGPDYDGAVCIRFRAWDLEEAIKKANTDQRLVKRIENALRSVAQE